MSNTTKISTVTNSALDRILDEYIENNNAKRNIQIKNIPHLVYLLLDVSGSMFGDKISQAQNGSKKFAKEAVEKGYLIGLVEFSNFAKLLYIPSQSLSGFYSTIDRIRAGGSTNLSMALDIATAELSKVEGKRVICVVTDGKPNNPNEALSIAQEAKNLGIEILAIGTNDADKQFLAKLVSNIDLAHIVDDSKLEEGVTNMAGLLSNPESK